MGKKIISILCSDNIFAYLDIWMGESISTKMVTINNLKFQTLVACPILKTLTNSADPDDTASEVALTSILGIPTLIKTF